MRDKFKLLNNNSLKSFRLHEIIRVLTHLIKYLRAANNNISIFQLAFIDHLTNVS